MFEGTIVCLVRLAPPCMPHTLIKQLSEILSLSSNAPIFIRQYITIRIIAQQRLLAVAISLVFLIL